MSWQFLSSLTVVFCITFIIFPGVICDTDFKFLEGVTDKNMRTSWKFLIFIVIFNLLDTIGRYLGGQSFATLPDKVVIGLAYFRLIFIAFSMCTAFKVNPDWLFGY